MAYKTAIIGLGRMGRRHLKIAREIGLDIVGICDLNPETLTDAANEFGVDNGRRFTNPHAMLAMLRPGCVIVATTAPSHCEYVCAAAEIGVQYILCEKPMAVSIAECDRMVDVCRRHGARLAVNHQMRFMEQYLEPKRLLNSPLMDGLSSVAVFGGNFGLAMNGSHYFEMFRFLTDETPFEVSAWFSAEKVPNPRGPQFEDRAGCVRVTTASGKRLYLDCSAEQGHGMTVIYCARNGQIIVNELTGRVTLFARQEQYRELPTTRYGMAAIEDVRGIVPADAFLPTKAVLDALLTQGSYPTGEDGRLAIEVLVAAYRSDESHAPVRIDDCATPRERVFQWA